jgi:hypothetical protein
MRWFGIGVGGTSLKLRRRCEAARAGEKDEKEEEEEEEEEGCENSVWAGC